MFIKITLIAVMAASSSYASSSPNSIDTNLLTGLPRLACQTAICLSSSTRPSECAESITHYFSIEVFKKGALDWSATVDARRAFLNMCPTGSALGMSQLVDAISKGAGRCDAAYLNQANRGLVERKRRVSQAGDNGDIIYIEKVRAVKDTLPGYCTAYYGHEWTYELDTKYVGTPCTGGHWVEAKDYETELIKWEAQWLTRSNPRSKAEGECTWAVETAGGDH